MHKQSFAAIISEQPKTLILGSLPGDLSLEVNQYYGHPRNRFWKMIFEIFETEFSEDYVSGNKSDNNRQQKPNNYLI